MIERSLTFTNKLSAFFLSHLWARIAAYGAIAALVFLVWVFDKGESVEFLYREF